MPTQTPPSSPLRPGGSQRRWALVALGAVVVVLALSGAFLLGRGADEPDQAPATTAAAAPSAVTDVEMRPVADVMLPFSKQHGPRALWSAATVKLIGAGLDDARLAEDLSRLIGDHDVPMRSVSYGDRRANESISVRRQRILGAEDVRALPRGTALLLATGCKPAMLDLTPWYAGPCAAAVTQAAAEAGQQLMHRGEEAS